MNVQLNGLYEQKQESGIEINDSEHFEATVMHGNRVRFEGLTLQLPKIFMAFLIVD